MDSTHPEGSQSIGRFALACKIRNGCNACQKMDALEDEIFAMGSVINPPKSFVTQYMATRTKMNRSHDPIILKVPRDIAARILEYCGPTDRDGGDYRLRACAVCRDWRKIALASPNVWRFLSVRLSSSSPWQHLLVMEWLGRTGTLPLSIEVYTTPRYISMLPKTNSFATAVLLINYLNLFSHRWQILRILDIPKEYLDAFKGTSYAASLQSLTILSPLEDQTSGGFALQRVIPWPAYVHLSGISIQAVNVAWYNVTSVRLDVNNLEEVFLLFKSSPGMCKLVIGIFGTWGDMDTVQHLPRSFTHENLQELHIDSNSRPWPFDEFLACFVLPSLQMLTIHDFLIDGWDTSHSPIPAIHSLTQSSATQLKHLTLSWSYSQTSEVVSLLGYLPTLEHLKLGILPGGRDQASHLPDELFMLLLVSGPPGDPPHLLPHLRSLAFDFFDAYNPRYFPNRRFPWNFLQGLCGKPSDLGNPLKRPLYDVELTFECKQGTLLNQNVIIDKELIGPLITLHETPGLRLYIHGWLQNVDLLQDYKQRYSPVDQPRMEDDPIFEHMKSLDAQLVIAT